MSLATITSSLLPALPEGGHGASFLHDLAIVLCVAAVTTVLFQRLRQPVVLGYLLAGVLVGPHLPLRLLDDGATLTTLADLGVVLLLFSLGLEFRLRKLVELGPTVAFATLLEVGLMLWLGFLAARLLGWPERECLFAGAIVAISSTVLIRKIFAELDVAKTVREIVTGILVFEDVFAVLILAALTAVAQGTELSFDYLLKSFGLLFLFLLTVLGLGLLLVPPAVRAIIRLRRKETVVVACVGFSFALALVSERAVGSLALGAFLAGMLVAESGAGEWIEDLLQPVRDVLAAVFFVSIGTLIDPAILGQHWLAIVLFSGLVIAGKVAGVTSGVFLAGRDMPTALRSGLCLAQIGELSFVIAALGATSGESGSFLSPLAVGVSATTAFVSPFLVREADRLTHALERRLPQPVVTFMALYGSWLEEIRGRTSHDERWKRVRRATFVVLLDAGLLLALLIGGSLVRLRVGEWVTSWSGMPPVLTSALVLGAVGAAAALPLVGILRGSKRLAEGLCEMALPSAGPGRVDTAAAPRRALAAALRFAIVLAVATVVAALSEPFLPRFSSPVVLVALIVPLVFVLYTSAKNLQGHVRAGAEIIVEALNREPPGREEAALEGVRRLLPGLGDVQSALIGDLSACAGKKLSDIDLSGVSVVVIQRGGERIVLPAGDEVLRSGDRLALTGAEEAVDEACRELESPAEPAAEVSDARSESAGQRGRS